MRREGRIVSYTDEELRAMIARGEDQSDWERVKAMTDEDLEASIDYEEEGHFDLSKGRMIYDPACKQEITLKLDPDVIDFFKAGGPDFADRMNAVLPQHIVANAK
jgi:uncharacterized protein (DUF4415 family)